MSSKSSAPPPPTPSQYMQKGRRDSLVRQASIDRVQNEVLKRRDTLRRRHELETISTFSKTLLNCLDDESVKLIKNGIKDQILNLSIIINCKAKSRKILLLITQKFLNNELQIKHIETRPDTGNVEELEIFVEGRGQLKLFVNILTDILIENQENNGENLIERIQLRESLAAIPLIINTPNIVREKIWIPKHVSDLDKCAHVLVKYEPTEDPKHPGFGDNAYIERRAQLNSIANSYHYGDTLPYVEYTKIENATWREAYTELKKLRPTHTCKSYQDNVALMENLGIIGPNKIPQLKDLSTYIQKRTGFELRPCGGLLSARDFLASLAFRVFQATLYVRHSSAPHHCPEPDVIHEILGHCPMFSDVHLAQLSQEIGLLSLGASDEQIERLSTVYWFIVEFGLCREDGKLKAIGAGLISAFGELQHACSDVPEHENFDPQVVAMRTYEDSDYQPLYFVADTIVDAMERLRIYALKLSTNQINVYDPLTKTIEQLTPLNLLKQKISNVEKNNKEICDLATQLFNNNFNDLNF